jgi:hypothetical protein
MAMTIFGITALTFMSGPSESSRRYGWPSPSTGSGQLTDKPLPRKARPVWRARPTIRVVPPERPIAADRSRRLTWEVIEVLSAGLLASATAIAGFSIASGIAFGFGSAGQPGTPFGGSIQIGPGLALIVQRSTLWAAPWVGLIILGAIGTAWWQVEGWETFIEDEESSASEQDYGDAFGHLLRTRTLTSWALAILALLAAAVVALVVSTFVLYAGGPSDVVLPQDLIILGEGIGTLILVGIATFASLRILRSVRQLLSQAEGDQESELDSDLDR